MAITFLFAIVLTIEFTSS